MIIHGQADILNLSLVEAYKESRQKRLVVKHGKYYLKTTILQYFIDTAAYTAGLYSIGGINLDSLKSRKLTSCVRIYMFVRTRIESLDKLLHRCCFGRSNLARPERNLTLG